MKHQPIKDVHHQGEIMVVTFADGSKAHLGDTTGVRTVPGSPVVLITEEEHDQIFDAALEFQTRSLPPEFRSTELDRPFEFEEED